MLCKHNMEEIAMDYILSLLANSREFFVTKSS